MGLRTLIALFLASISALAQTVTGPSSSTTNALAAWRDATGKHLRNVPFITTDGTNLFFGTNQVSVVDGELKLNGAAITGGGDQVWTNDAPTLRTISATNKVFIGDSESVYGGSFSYGLGVVNRESTTSTNVLYQGGGTISIIGDTPSGEQTIQSLGILGTGTYGATVAYGVAGLAATVKPASAAIGIAGVSFADFGSDETSVQVGGYFEIGASWDGPDPIHEAGVIVADNRGSEVPIFIGRTNNGTTVFKVDAAGVATTKGIGSTSTDAAEAIASGGWTNTFGKNAVVEIDGTGVTYVKYDNAGTSIYTNAATVTHATVLLQPSGKVLITAGSGITGRAAPF